LDEVAKLLNRMVEDGVILSLREAEAVTNEQISTIGLADVWHQFQARFDEE